MIGAAARAIARGGKRAELVFKLGKAPGVMHLPLRIAHRDRLGAHRLAAACRDKPDRHIGIGGLDRRAHHLAAEISFRDDAVGTKLMEGRHRATAPDGWRLTAGEIGQNIAIAVGAARGDNEADFVGGKIVAAGSA